MLRRIVVGSLQIAGGHGSTQILNFARNLIIARMIGPEEFGLGLTFVLLVAFLHMTADLGWDRFIVQDKDGDAEDLESTLHLFLALRGLVFAALLFLSAELVVRLLGVPADLAWTYRVLALVPAFWGFLHLDVKRYHRTLRYFPDMASQVVGSVASLVVGLAAAVILADFRAMLLAVVVRYAALAVSTHLFAERPYRVGFSREIAVRAWRFGWPLMISGFVLFAASQGDRAVVLRAFGLETFGVYGAVALVTLSVATLIQTVTSYVGLPILSKRGGQADFGMYFGRLGGLAALVSVGVIVGGSALLPVVIPFLYGGAFNIPALLVVLLVGALGVQIFRNAWAMVTALSLGSSRAVMTINVVRASGIGIAILAVALGGSILHVAAAQIAGEVAATAAGFLLLRWRHGLTFTQPATLFVVVAGAVAACVGLRTAGLADDFATSAALHGLVLSVAIAALVVLSAELRAVGAHVARRLASRSALWRMRPADGE